MSVALSNDRVLVARDVLEAHGETVDFGQDIADFYGSEEQGLLDSQIVLQSLTPGLADGGRGEDFFEFEAGDDVAKQFVGVEYGVCGRLGR